MEVNDFFADTNPDTFIAEAREKLDLDHGAITFKIGRNRIIPVSKASKLLAARLVRPLDKLSFGQQHEVVCAFAHAATARGAEFNVIYRRGMHIIFLNPK